MKIGKSWSPPKKSPIFMQFYLQMNENKELYLLYQKKKKKFPAHFNSCFSYEYAKKVLQSDVF